MVAVRAVGVVAVLCCCALQAAERWRLQYFYDVDSSSLALRDLQFPSARRGIAIGTLVEGSKHRSVVLATSDGGEKWDMTGVSEDAVSLFFLNDSLGWMVTDKGVWRTLESGRNWKKLARLRGLLRVHFLDEKHGFAVGHPKAVYETFDGGATWKPVPAAAAPKTTPQYTTYGWIDFLDGQRGLIAGWSRPPRRDESDELPDWMEPEKRTQRRELPGMVILLETRDGGRTWTPSETSLFGIIARFRLGTDGRGLSLIRFLGTFAYPSEVYRLDWTTGKTTHAFRRKDRDITDIAITPNGRAYLAGFEPPGSYAGAPIPGKLKVLVSDDYSEWREMDVDYRATARQAVLAVAGRDNLWLATDTGMILKLSPQ